MNRSLRLIANQSKLFYAVASTVAAVIVGAVDYITGVQVSFAVFYTLPIAIISWTVGMWPGVALSVVCASEWLTADLKDVDGFSSTPYWNVLMRFVIFVIIAVTLSKLHAALSRETAAREAADKASRIKSEFLANMSHELRTPMNAIIAMSDMLAESPSPVEQQKYVRVLRQEGGHLLRLLNDILDLSKVEAGQYEFIKAPFDLLGLVNHITSMMAVRAKEKGLNLTYRVMPDVPMRLIGDVESVRRIILNLTGNALKFTTAGNITLNVERVDGDAKTVMLRFSVRDTGSGIPPEKMEQIFERFVTVDSSLTRKVGGTGLGLNISRKLVEGMGGKLWAESELEKGSEFHFTLPFEISAAPIEKMAGAADESAIIESLSRDRRPLKLLLVEDYKSNQVIVQTFLKSTGYMIDLAENGEEAVQKFRDGRYDLVFMDVQMPVMDGYTATERIRAFERAENRDATPIIALTAHALKDESDRSIRAGCNAHLTKPIQKATLLKAIYDHTRSIPMMDDPTPEDTEGGIIVAIDPSIVSLAPQFLDDMRDVCGKMEDAFARNDFAAISSLGHKIKGSGGSYGFAQISEYGDALEVAAFQKNDDDTRIRIAEFKNYLANVEIVSE